MGVDSNGGSIKSGRKSLDENIKRTIRKELTLNLIESTLCNDLIEIYKVKHFRGLFDTLLKEALVLKHKELTALHFKRRKESVNA